MRGKLQRGAAFRRALLSAGLGLARVGAACKIDPHHYNIAHHYTHHRPR
jgi:hypothetical protein